MKNEIDFNRQRGYKRVIEITGDHTKETDSITGEKLDKIYMTVKFIPEFKTSQSPLIFYLNERSTPKEINSHWFWFNDRRKTALNNIRQKMDRYFIGKSEIK